MSQARACRLAAASAFATLALSGPVMAGKATVTISGSATKNMDCSSGVCAPTAAHAVLNVGDLEKMLASGDVLVTTDGAQFEADDLDVAGPVEWKSNSTLALEAYDSLDIQKPIAVKGNGELDLYTNEGGTTGTLSFAGKGHVTFPDLSGSLAINGAYYVLAGDISTLAADIAANPAGNFALARNYDASGDGTYSAPPIPTTLSGTFEGLGNTISNLTINDTTENSDNLVGLFADGAHLHDIGVTNANITAGVGGNSGGWTVGLLAGAGGTIENCHATGTVTVAGGQIVNVGGLAGFGVHVLNSHAAATVSVSDTDSLSGNVAVGGLIAVGVDVEDSYATGSVTASLEEGFAYAGGLVGLTEDDGTVSNSYATGNVSASTNDDDQSYAESGGLIGANGTAISSSYATGTVFASGGSSDGIPTAAGGLIGQQGTTTISDAYWDTTTSGTETGVGYGSSSGVTGLTTAQFQSGLPAGFASSIWREKAKINGGLPYLISNPPPK